jgi:hypothetical protein
MPSRLPAKSIDPRRERDAADGYIFPEKETRHSWPTLQALTQA